MNMNIGVSFFCWSSNLNIPMLHTYTAQTYMLPIRVSALETAYQGYFMN